jgi:hypothetical protein
MEKVMLSVRTGVPTAQWCAELRRRVVDTASELDFCGVTVNVRDSEVTDSIMTLTTFEPPIVAVISLWTQQYYGAAVAQMIRSLERHHVMFGAYLVT